MTEETKQPRVPAATAVPAPALSEPRPLGERRHWPRSFADRLTSPLPGVSAFARCRRSTPTRSPSPGPDTPAG
jgi:hypothetical protein